MSDTRATAAASAVVFVAAIVAANWLTNRYGFVVVGFGLTATAGTYAAGATLTLRDNVQDGFGRVATLVLIAFGALLSAFVSSAELAVASGVAFAVAEVCDLAVYTPLRERNWTAAVWASGLVGAVVDSLLFLRMAFGSEAVTRDAVLGQVVGKGWALLAVWALTLTVRQRRVA